MENIKKNWKFLLFVCLIGLVGGFFTSFYILEMLNEAQLASAMEKVGSVTALQFIAVLQTTIYAAIFGFFGLILSHKAGLWKPISFQRLTVAKVAALSVILGVAVAIIDSQVFALMIPQVAAGRRGAYRAGRDVRSARLSANSAESRAYRRVHGNNKSDLFGHQKNECIYCDHADVSA